MPDLIDQNDKSEQGSEVENVKTNGVRQKQSIEVILGKSCEKDRFFVNLHLVEAARAYLTLLHRENRINVWKEHRQHPEQAQGNEDPEAFEEQPMFS